MLIINCITVSVQKKKKIVLSMYRIKYGHKLLAVT